ncbi:Retrovirus-related Pol polyprotein from transposon RE1 [Sesamum angolense]|uniref:Retrovirus-related Pol polyprotein from transposon RE1 n=1 Tax=Sesamum angolense TaxID=2727404 RepID=A0AAE1WIS8_9LAMI|nr:Retrovirus-related Pol polyprotein from transposon RE1 [Sesamum angolense]
MASTSDEVLEVPGAATGTGNDNTTVRIQPLEIPGMIMISAPLNGNNWLSWSRSVRIAVEGREKLGFIDGSCSLPAEGTPQHKQWRITDYIVRTWILSTISKDIVNAYLYASSSRDLWMELEARYSECDGTLLYKLQREINSISQENLSVTAYYTKLKQLWDELVCLMPPAMCSCGLCICGCNKTKADQTDRSQLIQFLMGLNESYDNIRNQILVLEPLPNVNKAYSMVLRVERQRQVNSEFAEATDHFAMQVRSYEQRYNTGPRNIMKKKGPIDKRNLFCNHCNKSGHNKETCFKIHGFPDWYKDLNDQRRRQNISNRAYVVDDNEHKPAEKPDAAVCPLAKQTRAPFPPSDTHAQHPFDLIHVDIWGPYKHATLSGAHCVLTIVDDHSKSKFDPRAYECVFLGYAPSQKAYKLYDIHNKETLISRVVTFHESVFPYKSFNIASDNSSFPIPEPISDSFTDTPPTLSQPAEFPNLSESTITPTNTDPSTSTTSSPDIPVPSPILRRSQRHTQPPAWLRDFVQTSDHISSNLASSHSDFQAALSTVQEPRTYNQAKGCVEWELAMQKELSALEQNETWEVVDLPKGKRAIGSKWVYKVKLNPDGFVERYKARLVAKGSDDVTYHTSCVLCDMIDEGCHTSCVLCGISGDGISYELGLLVILVYVDDLLLTGCSKSLINEVKVYLDDAFTIKDLGYAKYFLGLEIAHSSAGTSVTQHKYVRDIITDAGLENCRPVSTPLPVGLNLTSHAQPALADPEPYRRLVGRLLYLGFTCPDISYGAQQLSQFVHHPSKIHMDAAMHLVCYLKGCPDLGLFFPSSNLLVLKAYCDADWASCVDSRRSLTGYCAALHIVPNPVFHERTKHLEFDCNLVRDKFKSGFILPLHIAGKMQLANLFTKLLSSPLFASFLLKLGLVSSTHAHLKGGLMKSAKNTTSGTTSVLEEDSVLTP